jgi:IPT/TIG domain
MKCLSRTMISAFIAASVASTLAGQAASSQNYFLPSVELANGANAASTNYRMCSVLGAGVVAVASASANHKMTGAYAATLDATTTGGPWLTAVTPRFATSKSAATLSLWGNGLNSSAAALKIGGVSSAVLSQQNHLITTKLPFLAGPPSSPGPGWHNVSVTNSGGTSTLPDAIGILPMLMTDPAPAANTAFDIVFKGSPGDTIVWVIGIPPIPPIPIGNFLYGLAVNPLITLPGFAISNANGEFRLPVAPTPYLSPFFAQALFVSSNPGYAPGSFSNVLKF